ncbi:beta-xylanase [Cellulomonas carbonis]|uniref:Beta-xylanase n=2 Tax=Cellulomonas carbonis TaxID=1386092 RepID=A0A0A0BWJ6_9CELL|nr:1,4-beta-xylanase [Cellulomonas carbonis T26]GGC01282.1 beta-xylanase [Cellulomonas carbonis]
MSFPAPRTYPVDPAMSHRRGQTTVRVLDTSGSPLADTDVVVEQRSHSFAFGCIGFDFIGLANDETGGGDGAFGGATAEQAAELTDAWLDVFNTATLPFYWAGFEPERGRPDTERLRRAAEWFAARGVTVKGHPLVWHTLAPHWLLDLDTAEVERVQRDRIRRDVSGFAGLVDTWDAINEVVIMPVFDKEENGITRLCRERGRIATIRMAFEEARAANPSATLVLNDFDMSTAYECLIEGVLEAGIEVDAIGLQSHMHQGYWGEEKTLRILERFARYGLPLHLTESTLLSGELMPPEIVDLNDYQVPSWPSTPEGEARQADEVVRHYRTLLSHPSVATVNYWGLTDAGAWLGAPVGLVRADGTRKPAFDALRGLVKDEWWVAPTTTRTDADGLLTIEGWGGTYGIGPAGGTGSTATVTVEPSGAHALGSTPATNSRTVDVTLP